MDAGDFKIEHFPTTKMRGVYFTKPLQGKIFRYFQTQLMGFTTMTTDREPHSLENFDDKQTVLLKECVGRSQHNGVRRV